MKILDAWNSKVWVKLTPKGIAGLTEECANIAFLSKNVSMAQKLMEGYAKQDQWFEFDLIDFMHIFGKLVADKKQDVLFQGNQIFLERPY